VLRRSLGSHPNEATHPCCSPGQRKKRAAPPPPIARPLPSAISAQGLERIVDSDESLTSDMDLSKPSSDIDVGPTATGDSGSSKASSDLGCHLPEESKRTEEQQQQQQQQQQPPPPLDPARVAKKGKLVARDPDAVPPARPLPGPAHRRGFEARSASLRQSKKKILVKVPSIAALRRRGSLDCCPRARAPRLADDVPRLGELGLVHRGCHPEPGEEVAPPALSSLAIFAISTKPEDVQLAPMDESIPGDIEGLPSLPIVERTESRFRWDGRLSILEPPPPGLVSREESSENWNRFLERLNSILDSRTGEFV
jgi:hypothetical protein